MFITRNITLLNSITALVFIVSIVILALFGLRPSIDFTGGSLTEVSYTTVPQKNEVLEKLDALGLTGYSLREAIDDSGKDGYILRSKELTETERKEVTTSLTALGEGGEIGRFTTIGPVIGEELKSKAFYAIGAVVLVIVFYVAFAFRGLRKPVGSWVYGGVTILSLFHDVLVPTAVMSLLGHIAGAEIDILFVMAILAVLGYSVNDTIVVLDRVRENLLAAEGKKGEVEPFRELVGRSIKQTFLRSFNTSFTTLITLIALYLFGGDVTHYFALVLIVGVVAGTYSSIFMASPLLVWYAESKYAKKHAS